MVKLCIRTIDKINSDWYKDIGCLKRGHVVEVLRGDQVGGARDIERTDLKIVAVDMPYEEAKALMSAEPGDPKVTLTLRRRRMFRLDIDSLPIADKTQFDDKANMTKEGSLTIQEVRDSKVYSDIPINPNLIG